MAFLWLLRAPLHATPISFASHEDAISWGCETGVFKDVMHAQNAYEEVKRTHQPTHSSDMWALWIVEVMGCKGAMDNAIDNPFDDNTIGASVKTVRESHMHLLVRISRYQHTRLPGFVTHWRFASGST